MKRMVAAIMLTALLWSCGKDKGTGPGGGSPAVWSPIDSISFAGYPANPRMLLVDGNVLYVAGDGGFLACVDISDPDSLKVLGYHASVGTGGEYPVSMAKRNNYLVCSFDAGYGHPDTLEVFDVSNPANPQSVTVLESEPIPMISDYWSFGTCVIAGDTLLTLGGRLYRIGNDGSLNFLDNFTASEIGGCPYAGMLSVWTESNYWYFTGVCIDTDHHPQLWVVERGTMNVIARSPIPSDFYIAYYHGTAAAGLSCFYNGSTANIMELNYANHASPFVSRTVVVPGGFILPDTLIPDPTYAHWSQFVPVQSGFVAIAREGFVLLDADYKHVRNYWQDRGEWFAASKGNRLYEIGGGAVNLFAIL